MRLTLLIPLLFLTACFAADDDALPVIDYDISDESKSYLVFKIGSKWTYKNTATNEIDQIELYYHRNDNTVYESWDPVTRTKFLASVYNFLMVFRDSENKRYFFSKHQNTVDSIVFDIIRENEPHMIPFFQPFNSGSTVVLGDTLTASVLEHKVNEVVSGKTYTDVVIFSSKLNGVSNNNTVNYHYAPNVGLIKRELVDSGYSWELIDYAVEQ